MKIKPISFLWANNFDAWILDLGSYLSPFTFQTENRQILSLELLSDNCHYYVQVLFVRPTIRLHVFAMEIYDHSHLGPPARWRAVLMFPTPSTQECQPRLSLSADSRECSRVFQFCRPKVLETAACRLCAKIQPLPRPFPHAHCRARRHVPYRGFVKERQNCFPTF